MQIAGQKEETLRAIDVGKAARGDHLFLEIRESMKNPSWIDSPNTEVIFLWKLQLSTIHKSMEIWSSLILVFTSSLLLSMKAQVASLRFLNYVDRRAMLFIVTSPAISVQPRNPPSDTEITSLPFEHQYYWQCTMFHMSVFRIAKGSIY